MSARKKPEERPANYKTLCISMYAPDIERMDAKVEALKARGVRHASRSALIRYALDQIDPATVPEVLG